ncbi:hypothetical protein NIES4071_104490 (plasmid) [Calothrix sp. NIES-4071]|nr:hypothetical protein NIES4071_104490 [Calothrix sp. NIES-4071]BAZ64436.1 hypothetical protein NIES4105_101690 [Calothrix sp. NIES-4105]
MKTTLIYTGAMFVVAATAFTCIDYASAVSDNTKHPNTDSQYQFSIGNWRIVKHSFQLRIPKDGKPLSQLIIEAPSTVAVSNDIEVLNTKGQKININTLANGKQIIINFPEKVIYNTKLLVNLNRVRQPITGPASVYRLSAKVVGSDTEIFMGEAQFPTF